MHCLDSLVASYGATLLTCEYPRKTIDWCVISDDGDNFVVVDSRLDIQHLRFTIAHEVGHLHYWSIWGASKYDEQEADASGRDFLINRNDLFLLLKKMNE